MKKTEGESVRSIKELLEIMLENKHLFEKGLCAWASNLRFERIINIDEWSELRSYIGLNKPSGFLYNINYYKLINNNLGFYWIPGKIRPRISWIKKHIKLNS